MILVVLLRHGLQERRGIKHLRVHGKGSKIRLLHLHPVAAERLSLLKRCAIMTCAKETRVSTAKWSWRLVTIIRSIIHRIMTYGGLGTGRLVVSVILTVIPIDHVVARQLFWIGHLEHILTSSMVDATSRIKHLVNELVITNDPHSVTAFRGYQVGGQPIIVQLIVVIEPRFYVDEIATVYHTRPAITQIFDSAVTMQM
ncbi:hypothetical protein ALP51_200025 [Pseudomonas savastanoi]|uniref:Uncharacterized protein n=1 Tax=Pseudomonas savastanoi TaxID=29438 RepID=A0A3M5JX99_PSESS|nr:hypothetical protein ALP51_200025 [Pseudomonas savastanoi]